MKKLCIRTQERMVGFYFKLFFNEHVHGNLINTKVQRETSEEDEL